VKVRYGQMWSILRACSLVLLAIFVAASGFRAPSANDNSHNTQKNPKLSTPLAILASAVHQQGAPLAAGESAEAEKGFSSDKLPKPVQDSIQAGIMRINKNAAVQVYIEVTELKLETVNQLRIAGATLEVVSGPTAIPGKTSKLGDLPLVFSGIPIVQANVPASRLQAVAALSFVKFVRLPSYGVPQTGSVDTQGDSILQANLARMQFGVDGTSVRVGVISSGIGGIFDPASCSLSTEVPNPIQTGDLPNNVTPACVNGVLTSASGGIVAQSFPSTSPNLMPQSTEASSGFASEGTAMLEIVHDLAPGAQLYFANSADGTSMSFEQAVNFLAENADVVVDDIGFLVAPPGVSPATSVGVYDGNDAVSSNTAAALNTDGNPIRAYFTAVGNFAQNHYGGQYVNSGMDGTPITGEPGSLHLFQAVASSTTDNEGFGPSIFDALTVPPDGNVAISLVWNDPFGASTNDYDLFLVPLSCRGLDPVSHLPLPPCTISGPPVGQSTDLQMGTQDPVEVAVYSNSNSLPVAVGIVIQNVKNAAAARTFDMFIAGGLGNAPNHSFNTVSGSVLAEGDAGGSPVSVVSVGAIDQTQCPGPGSCTGSVEPYSSQGPTEATPQAASRMKPDLTATDDVSVTGAGGFGMNGSNATATGPCPQGNPSPPGCYFAGTSAAAPHAAAIAALVLQASSASSVGQTPATQRANLRNFLTSTALALPGISEPVPNNIEGFGLLDAVAAVKAAGGIVTTGSFSVSSNPASLSIAATGQSGTSTVTVTGTNGFTGTVSFACSVSPVPANNPPTCFANPSSVALNATTTSATANLRISTTAGLNSGLRPENRPNTPDFFAASVGLVLACIFMLGLPRPRKQWTASLGLVVLVLMGVALSSCASGSGGSSQINFGTPTGSYTVTLTASGGGTAQTTNVAVTIQ
jgi:Subtilase family